MAIRVYCRTCDREYSVRDEMAGKRVRCKGCGRALHVSDDEEDLEDDFEDDDEDDEPPRRRRSPKGNGRKSKSRRGRESDQVATPFVPMLYAILSCVLFCAPPVGAALGMLAFAKANAALDSLPSGKRGNSARNNMGYAKVIGLIGCCISLLTGIVAIIWQALSRAR